VKNYLIWGTAFSMLAGCAPFQHTEAPLATNFETSKQIKLQAAHHWQVIANDMADTLASALAKGTDCAGPAQNCASMAIGPTIPLSAFGKAFQSQFVSRLVNKGVNVSADSEADIVVSIDAQTVKFSPGRSQYLGAAKFTLISTGLWGLHEIERHESLGAAAFTAAVIADVVQWNMSEFAKGPTPQIELILTTSATKNGKYLARTTNVYYIADKDASLYCWKPEGCGNPNLPPPPIIRLVGDCGPAPCTSTGAPTPDGVR